MQTVAAGYLCNSRPYFFDFSFVRPRYGLREPPTPESSTMASARYQYSPLSESRQIRLLKLHPRVDAKDLQVSVDLITVSLDTAPPFTALSYAWGDPLLKAEIRCCGLAATTGLSLYSALRQLRTHTPHPERLIWADALCINQENITERNAQVRMMGDIYARATNTMIWLGEEDDDVARATEYFQRFFEAWEILYAGGPENVVPAYFAEVGTNNSLEAENALQSAFGEHRLEAYRAMWMLLHRPWFTRKWVIQEVAKSTKHEMELVAGSKKVTWKAVQAWVWFLVTSPKTLVLFLGSCPWRLQACPGGSSDVYYGFLQAKTLALMRDQEASLMLLLARTLPFKCTDPRDHIIALLGIATDGRFHGDLIDYDIPAEELYLRVARACLKRSQDLKILWSFLSIMPVDQRSNSWMPNIEELPAIPGLAMKTLEVSHTFDTASNTCTSTNLDASMIGNRLQVKGRIVDRLKQVGRDMSALYELGNFVQTMFATEDEHAISRMYTWLDECCTISQLAKQDENGYLVALLAENISKTHTPETIPAAQIDFPAYGRALEAVASAKNEATWYAAMANLADQEYLGQVESLMFKMLYRRFSRTLNGAIGWVPLAAEEGDLIGVLDGMELPYCVRPKNGIGGVYELVGECLIPDLMAEEATSTDRTQSVIFTLE